MNGEATKATKAIKTTSTISASKLRPSQYTAEQKPYDPTKDQRVKSITGPKQLGAGIFLPAPFQAPQQKTC
jgi:hypothetical protein